MAKHSAGTLQTSGTNAASVPSWNDELHELSVDGTLVKAFRQPARNQFAILAALQEAGWPRHVDDPIPPTPGVGPKARLHEAIRRLNLCQRPRLIIFRGDGTGAGILWEFVRRRLRRNADR